MEIVSPTVRDARFLSEKYFFEAMIPPNIDAG